MEEFKYVIFQLGEYKYAMNLMCVNGIEQDYRIIPVPNAPEGILGIINLRGAVIPVYSLRARFGMDPHIDSAEKSLLLTQSDDAVLGYEVDAVISIEQIEPGDINRMPRMASNEETKFMEEVLHWNNDIVISITVDEVLSEETRNALEDIISENEQNEK